MFSIFNFKKSLETMHHGQSAVAGALPMRRNSPVLTRQELRRAILDMVD